MKIDGWGRARWSWTWRVNSEARQTLKALLSRWIDESKRGFILICSLTGRCLEPALLRQGDSSPLLVARPYGKGREEILRLHTRTVPMADDCELSIIARGTPVFSGSDLPIGE